MTEGAVGDKRKRADLSKHKMNCNFALDKDKEVSSFAALLEEPPLALQGIGEVGNQAMEEAGLKTIGKMADWKYFKWSRAIYTLSQQEEEGKRLDGAILNCNNAVVKDYEAMSFTELAEAPLAALQGLTERHEKMFKDIHVSTIAQLAQCKYFLWAEAIEALAAVEEAPEVEEEEPEAKKADAE